MGGEGKSKDYKLRFNPNDAKSMTKLVKSIVAMANSGGGEIIFGRDETQTPGIPPTIADHLDSARLADQVDRYVEPGLIHIRHEFDRLDKGNFICTIIVEPATYPVVMRRQGTWSGAEPNDKPLFLKGDIWVRHGSRNERLSQADSKTFIDDAYKRGIDQVLSAAQIVREAGPDSAVGIQTEPSVVIRSPIDLLNLALSKRERNLPHLLSGKELHWLFILRNTFRVTLPQLELIIESALRRPSTLFWWLRDSRITPELIKGILFSVPSATDRDKSDAARSVVELAAVYLDEEDIDRLMEELAASRYAHFKSAAGEYSDRETIVQNLKSRAQKASHDKTKLVSMPADELEALAEEIANAQASNPSSGGSRRLADILRCIWLLDRDDLR